MAKGFHDLLFILASMFWFFIRWSKTADLLQNLIYIILVAEFYRFYKISPLNLNSLVIVTPVPDFVYVVINVLILPFV